MRDINTTAFDIGKKIGQATNEEEEMSGDFEQLAKQEILKCRINSLKKQQVYL